MKTHGTLGYSVGVLSSCCGSWPYEGACDDGPATQVRVAIYDADVGRLLATACRRTQPSSNRPSIAVVSRTTTPMPSRHAPLQRTHGVARRASCVADAVRARA